ncbi:MAG: hypothetical protein JGK37_13595 [Microcoleus sp. PH2017_06_SFM_O_A]|uniref:hypothetical protein n=1 Tax=Microcoleus sp. PH2017_31_RDM_U_A TaxID=2798841 RepID=UPI001DE85DDE|nr:hypothetical protein [Microcoleus sp. PH2017_31_RDM_U_A]MCC3466991.1 hypothetical protein [Microcoleus sp. PH2017_06_SFM_O_A]
MVRVLHAIAIGCHWQERSNRSIFCWQGFADRTFLSKLDWVRVCRAIDRPTRLLAQLNSETEFRSSPTWDTQLEDMSCGEQSRLRF